MHQHVPLAHLGSPGLPLTSYDQLGSRRRSDLPWPRERPPQGGRRPRRGLLRRIGQVGRVARTAVSPS